MPILYALVSKGNIILASHASVRGNLEAVASKILEQLPQSQDGMRKTYETGDYRFNIFISGGMTFLCMTDRAFSTSVSFHFLSDIYDKWLGRFGIEDDTVAVTGSKNDEFGRTLEKQMDYFSHDPNADKIRKVKEAVRVVKDQMVDNIDKLLERGEGIEQLLTKTEELETGSYAFKAKATELKRHYWWKSCKLYFILAALLLIIGYGVGAYICKSPIYKGCWGKKHSSPNPPVEAPHGAPTAPISPMPPMAPNTTKSPQATPVSSPSEAPSIAPSAAPSKAPHSSPSASPGVAPVATTAPSTPTQTPQAPPTQGSITIPTESPTDSPTEIPTTPTVGPSAPVANATAAAA